MVDVIRRTPQERKPTLSEQLGLNEFLSKAGGGLGAGFAESMGYESPEIKKLRLQESLRGENEKNKNIQDLQADKKDYETIKKHFGEKAAEIWESSTEGGKTKLLGSLLETAQRGENFEDSISSQLSDIPTTDFDKGLTPKERTRRQEARYSINLPLYQASQEKLRSLDSEKDHLEILEDLSPQISTADKFNIDPRTGEILFPGLASEQAQRFAKTINDFTTNAKDSYGSRVTNFDLQQFMRRLPTLANSEEGRRQIIEQMKIINDINTLRESTIQNVIDEHGGIRNIDYDAAERVADKHTKSKTSELKKRFFEIDKKNSSSFNKQISKDKALIPKDRVAVMFNDGSTGHIDKSKVSEFLKDNDGSLL